MTARSQTNELPYGWTEVALGEITHEIRASVRPLSRRSYELYSVPAFRRGRPEVLLGSEIASPKRPVRPNDLLFCKLETKLSRVWAVADHESGLERLAATEYLALRTDDARLTRYLAWYLRSPRFRAWMQLHLPWHQPAARDELIKQAMVPVGPGDQQSRIVDAVEACFASLPPCRDGWQRTRCQLQLLARFWPFARDDCIGWRDRQLAADWAVCRCSTAR